MNQPAKTITEQELTRDMGRLFTGILKLSHPVESLHQIREKIYTRGYQPFDAEDILGELGRLEQILTELHGTMLRIHDHLKQPGAWMSQNR